MAGVHFHGTIQIDTIGTSKVTLLQIIAAANHRVKLSEFSVAFNGTTNTNEPILLELARQTDAGTMSSLTLEKDNEGDNETIQTTAQHTATAEPTTGNTIRHEYIHPQTGQVWQAPWAKEFTIIGGNRLGFIVTAANDVDATLYVAGEE